MRKTLRRLVQRIVEPASVQRHALLMEQQIASLQEHRAAESFLLERMEELQAQQRALAQTIEEQHKTLHQLRRMLPEVVRKETLNAVGQIQAYLNLQSLWQGTGTPLPSMQGWTVCADTGLALAELLQAERYNLVVEFGSGSSTVLMGRVLQRVSSGRLVSFDHLPHYHGQTAAMLERHKLGAVVELVLAPLTSRTGNDGREHLYYDCDPALAQAERNLEGLPNPKVLLFVDGPPGATGPLARYPALGAALAHFPACELHCLLDDYGREDEKNTVVAWEAELQRAGRSYTHTVLPLQKGGSLLRIAPVAVARPLSPVGGDQA